MEQTRLLLARGLDPERYEQRVMCLDQFGALPAQLRDAGCAVDRIGGSESIFDVANHRNALALVGSWRPDIIHGAVYEGVAIAAVAGRLGGVPVILGEETSDPVNRSVAGHVLYRALAGMTHRMVAVSPAVQEYLTQKIRIPSEKVALVLNGVGSPAPSEPGRVEAIRQEFGIGDGSFVVGTVGRLEDSCKRISDLIRAMPALCEMCADPRLLVVGDGEDASMLRGLAESLGVAHRVHFCGYQGETADYYRAMDVFALASAHEAFGLVLVEAMLAGLAVVATRVGGIPTVVCEGTTALLVDPLAPGQLAAALAQLHRDPEARHAMGRQGHARAVSEFGAERYVGEVDALYMDLLEKARAT